MSIKLPFKAPLDMDSEKITNVADPTANNDAANKSYVDSVVAGDVIPAYADNTAYIVGELVRVDSDVYLVTTAVPDTNTTDPADNDSFARVGSSGVTEWEANTAYKQGDIVFYKTTRAGFEHLLIYASRVDHTSEALFSDAETIKWERLDDHTPTYVDGQGYLQGDIIFFNNKLYKARNDFVASTSFVSDLVAGNIVDVTGTAVDYFDNQPFFVGQLVSDDSDDLYLVTANVPNTNTDAPADNASFKKIDTTLDYITKADDVVTLGDTDDEVRLNRATTATDNDRQVADKAYVDAHEGNLVQWVSGTVYAVNDLVTNLGVIYRVTTATDATDTTAPADDADHYEEIGADIEFITKTGDVVTVGDTDDEVRLNRATGASDDPRQVADKGYVDSHAGVGAVTQWVSGTAYTIDTLVAHEGKIYRVISATTATDVTAPADDATHYADIGSAKIRDEVGTFTVVAASPNATQVAVTTGPDRITFGTNALAALFETNDTLEVLYNNNTYNGLVTGITGAAVDVTWEETPPSDAGNSYKITAVREIFTIDYDNSDIIINNENFSFILADATITEDEGSAVASVEFVTDRISKTGDVVTVGDNTDEVRLSRATGDDDNDRQVADKGYVDGLTDLIKANGDDAAAANGQNSIAIGDGTSTDATAHRSIAIGAGASTGDGRVNSIAIGANATTTANNELVFGASSGVTALTDIRAGTEYTPSGDTSLTTKKYVDDAITDAEGSLNVNVGSFVQTATIEEVTEPDEIFANATSITLSDTELATALHDAGSLTVNTHGIDYDVNVTAVTGGTLSVTWVETPPTFVITDYLTITAKLAGSDANDLRALATVRYVEDNHPIRMWQRDAVFAVDDVVYYDGDLYRVITAKAANNSTDPAGDQAKYLSLSSAGFRGSLGIGLSDGSYPDSTTYTYTEGTGALTGAQYRIRNASGEFAQIEFAADYVNREIVSKATYLVAGTSPRSYYRIYDTSVYTNGNINFHVGRQPLSGDTFLTTTFEDTVTFTVFSSTLFIEELNAQPDESNDLAIATVKYVNDHVGGARVTEDTGDFTQTNVDPTADGQVRFNEDEITFNSADLARVYPIGAVLDITNETDDIDYTADVDSRSGATLTVTWRGDSIPSGTGDTFSIIADYSPIEVDNTTNEDIIIQNINGYTAVLAEQPDDGAGGRAIATLEYVDNAVTAGLEIDYTGVPIKGGVDSTVFDLNNTTEGDLGENEYRDNETISDLEGEKAIIVAFRTADVDKTTLSGARFLRAEPGTEDNSVYKVPTYYRIVDAYEDSDSAETRLVCHEEPVVGDYVLGAFVSGGVYNTAWTVITNQLLETPHENIPVLDYVKVDATTSPADAVADGENSLAIGNQAESPGNESIAIGFNADTGNNGAAIAIGTNADTGNSNAVALGRSTDAGGASSVAIGNSADAGGTGNVALGYQSEATSNYTAALGPQSNASGNESVAIGRNATTSDTRAFAIGRDSVASQDDAFAIGTEATSAHARSTAIGEGAGTEQADEIRLGKSGVEVTVSSTNAGAEQSDNQLVSKKYVDDHIASHNQIINVSAANSFKVEENPEGTFNFGLWRGANSNEVDAYKMRWTLTDVGGSDGGDFYIGPGDGRKQLTDGIRISAGEHFYFPLNCFGRTSITADNNSTYTTTGTDIPSFTDSEWESGTQTYTGDGRPFSPWGDPSDTYQFYAWNNGSKKRAKAWINAAQNHGVQVRMSRDADHGSSHTFPRISVHYEVVLYKDDSSFTTFPNINLAAHDIDNDSDATVLFASSAVQPDRIGHNQSGPVTDDITCTFAATSETNAKYIDGIGDDVDPGNYYWFPRLVVTFLDNWDNNNFGEITVDPYVNHTSLDNFTFGIDYHEASYEFGLIESDTSTATEGDVYWREEETNTEVIIYDQSAGHIPASTLASGPTSSTFLRGDNTWAAPPASPFLQVNSTGNSAEAGGTDAIAIGEDADATGIQSVAIGFDCSTGNNYNVAIGQSVTTGGWSAVGIGRNAQAGSTSIAIGRDAYSQGTRSIAIGSTTGTTGDNAHASGTEAIAIGTNTSSSGTDTVAIGTASSAAGTGTVALGTESGASGNYSLGIGRQCEANGSASLAMGTVAKAWSHTCVAIGAGSEAGVESDPNTQYSAVAIGRDATASHQNAVVFGRDASSSTFNQIALGPESGTGWHVRLPSSTSNPWSDTSPNGVEGAMYINTNASVPQLRIWLGPVQGWRQVVTADV